LRLQRQFKAQSYPLRPCNGRDNNAIGTQLSGGVFQECPDAKNDDRRFGYDAGECPGVLPKRNSGWFKHRTASGKANGRGARETRGSGKWRAHRRTSVDTGISLGGGARIIP
jgi:hypothetical protein